MDGTKIFFIRNQIWYKIILLLHLNLKLFWTPFLVIIYNSYKVILDLRFLPLQPKILILG